MFDRKNQRTVRRIDIECPINYKNVNTTDFKQGTAKNISSKGVLFVTDEEFEVGTMMEIKIVPGDSSIPAHGAIIEVVRVNPTDSGKNFEIAGLIKVMK
jgi:hypothetical protein